MNRNEIARKIIDCVWTNYFYWDGYRFEISDELEELDILNF